MSLNVEDYGTAGGQTTVRHEGARGGAICCSVTLCEAVLRMRWREALRSRPAGGGFKPPQAAVIKSHGSERWGKGSARRNQVSVKETNTSEPLITCRKPMDVVKTRGELLTWEESGGDLLTAQMAAGMKAA